MIFYFFFFFLIFFIVFIFFLNFNTCFTTNKSLVEKYSDSVISRGISLE